MMNDLQSLTLPLIYGKAYITYEDIDLRKIINNELKHVAVIVNNDDFFLKSKLKYPELFINNVNLVLNPVKVAASILHLLKKIANKKTGTNKFVIIMFINSKEFNENHEEIIKLINDYSFDTSNALIISVS